MNTSKNCSSTVARYNFLEAGRLKRSSGGCVARFSGVSAGFRISSDHNTPQQYQPLTNADRGKIEQERRKFATSRNQKPDKE